MRPPRAPGRGASLRLGAGLLAAGLAVAGLATAAAAQGKAAPSPAPRTTAKPASSNTPPGQDPDPAYTAFQRGRFRTALDLAVSRANGEGDVASMVLAAELLSQGYGVRQDPAAAQKWYEAAAARGNADALFTLGAILMASPSTVNKDQAVDFFRRAGENGSARAAYNLGLVYLQGEVAPKEPAIAAEWFKRAAETDQPDALYALATLYRDGNGVPRDPIESARLLQRASEVGNDVATTELAIAVFNGIGMPKDEERAAALFRKAALQGNVIAQNRYARILSAGRGVPKDVIAAAGWHLAAKAQKLDDPMLDKLVAGLTPDQRAQAEKLIRPWAPPAAY